MADEAARFARDVSRMNSGTPASYKVQDKTANGTLDSSDVNSEQSQRKNKSFVSELGNSLKESALRKVSGQLSPQERQQYLLDRANAKKGKSSQGRSFTGEAGFRLTGDPRRLRGMVGGNHQNPLIQVGRQEPNPFLVNKPFTASGYRNMPPLRSRGYPIGSRPTNFINTFGVRKASPYDKYFRR